jgi:hypothetical protein
MGTGGEQMSHFVGAEDQQQWDGELEAFEQQARIGAPCEHVGAVEPSEVQSTAERRGRQGNAEQEKVEPEASRAVRKSPGGRTTGAREGQRILCAHAYFMLRSALPG